MGSGVKVQGDPDLNKGASWVKGNAEYFDSVGTHVVMGRGFTLQDTLSAPPVAVVNQEFVKQFFGNRNPIGHRFGFSGPGSAGMDGAHEIVGVVEDTTYTSVYWKNHAMYFLPLTQRAGSAKDLETLSKKICPCTPEPWSSRPPTLFPALKSSSATPWPASTPTSLS